jgi:hypothetical protein
MGVEHVESEPNAVQASSQWSLDLITVLPRGIAAGKTAPSASTRCAAGRNERARRAAAELCKRYALNARDNDLA